MDFQELIFILSKTSFLVENFSDREECFKIFLNCRELSPTVENQR